MYNTFLPQISNYSKQGLACTKYITKDLTKFNWFYFWGPANKDPRCIPMSYYGLPVNNLSLDYDNYLLVFNEPNAFNQANLTPTEASIRYENLRLLYPKAKMVVGNVNQDGLIWLKEFKSLIKNLPEVWGYHGYMHGNNTPLKIETIFETAQKELEGKFWITEWGDIDGNINNTIELKNYLNQTNWIERWFYYTNRKDLWYPINWKTNLFDEFDNSTELYNIF